VTKQGDPVFGAVPVTGGTLRTATWGDGPHTVVTAHGITSSARSWAWAADRLPPGWRVVAVDLRGRAGSVDLPGPYGLEAHAADLAAVIETIGSEPVTVAGHSMGAFVAVVLAAQHPARVGRLVLVDGGLPLAASSEPIADVDAVLAATLGPALARLQRTFPSPAAYLDYWRVHPALQECWSAELEDYLRHDLAGTAPDLRCAVSEDAVRADGADMLANTDLLRASLKALQVDTALLRAPRGLLNEDTPFQPEGVAEHWAGVVPTLHHELVADTNHYSLLLGERGASVVAARMASTGGGEDGGGG